MYKRAVKRALSIPDNQLWCVSRSECIKYKSLPQIGDLSISIFDDCLQISVVTVIETGTETAVFLPNRT